MTPADPPPRAPADVGIYPDGNFSRACPYCPTVTQGGQPAMMAHLTAVHRPPTRARPT